MRYGWILWHAKFILNHKQINVKIDVLEAFRSDPLLLPTKSLGISIHIGLRNVGLGITSVTPKCFCKAEKLR